jgi:hypothetical protein
LPDEIKESLAAWAGCVSGALDIGDYVAGLEQAGFIDIEVIPVYFDESTIIEAAEQTGFSEVVKTGDRSLFKSVYSAKITAFRPNS